MIIDERYLENLMYLIAVANDPTGLSDEQIDEARKNMILTLQQGKALLDKGGDKLDKKININEIPKWKDFRKL